MNDDVLNADERDLADLYTRVTPPAAAIRARVDALAMRSAPRRAPSRRLVVALAGFALTAVVVAAVAGARGLHGGPQRGATAPAVSPGRTPVPSATVAAPPSCRIAVFDQVSHQARLFSPQVGAYTADASVQAQGEQYDGWSAAWDAPLGRWVHSTWSLVSPDGRMWLYRSGGTSSSTGILHLVDASGGDRPLVVPGANGRSGAPGVMGWLPEGILYSSGTGSAVAYHFYDPATGTVRDAGIPQGGWRWFGGRSLWDQSRHGTDVTVRGYDLDTHALTTWFSLNDYLGPAPVETPSMTSEGPRHTIAQSSRTMGVLAADAQGHPVIHLGSRDTDVPVQTLYLDRPGHVVVIDEGVRPTERLDPYSAIGDAHGVWFLDFTGNVFLYHPGGQLQNMGTAPSSSSRSVTSLAGPCQ